MQLFHFISVAVWIAEEPDLDTVVAHCRIVEEELVVGTFEKEELVAGTFEKEELVVDTFGEVVNILVEELVVEGVENTEALDQVEALVVVQSCLQISMLSLLLHRRCHSWRD